MTENALCGLETFSKVNPMSSLYRSIIIVIGNVSATQADSEVFSLVDTGSILPSRPAAGAPVIGH